MKTIIFFMMSFQASASISIGSWVSEAGSAPIGDITTSGLTWGNGNPNNASGSFISAVIDADGGQIGNQSVFLSVGQKLIFSGRINFAGLAVDRPGASQFRIGLFNDGSDGTNTSISGWNGYFIGNATSSEEGVLYRRDGVGAYLAEINTTQLTRMPSTNDGTVSPTLNLTDGNYEFSLIFERVSDGLIISTSLIRESDGVNFASLSDLLDIDSTGDHAAFNRLGFMSSSSIEADQLLLSNLSLVVVPEPSIAVLSLLLAGLIGRRCARG